MRKLRSWYPALLFVISLVVALAAYRRLPTSVPTHWDVRGHVDRTGPRWLATFLFPAMILVLWGILRGLPLIDPRRANYARMQGTYDLVVNLTLTLIVALHLIVLASVLGAPVAIDRAIPAVVGVALVIMGNVLPRAKPNWWFGIRTPWTLSNDRVWERTHRIGGYVISGVGLLAIAIAIIGVPVATVVLGGLAAAMALGLIAYSYVIWREETSR